MEYPGPCRVGRPPRPCQTDQDLVELVRKKLAVPGNERVDVLAARLAALKRQVASQLKPVLRDRDFAEFDLDRAFATVAELAALLS